MDKITLCGDNCLYCPRYLAKSDEELNKIALSLSKSSDKVTTLVSLWLKRAVSEAD